MFFLSRRFTDYFISIGEVHKERSFVCTVQHMPDSASGKGMSFGLSSPAQ